MSIGVHGKELTLSRGSVVRKQHSEEVVLHRGNEARREEWGDHVGDLECWL